MDNSSSSSSSGTGKLLVGLLVGAVAGYAIAKLTSTPPTPLDVCHTVGNHTINVALDGQLDCPEVVIVRTNVVRWYSPSNTTLTITPTSNTVSVSCGLNSCYTTQITTPGTVDYDVKVTGGTQSAPIRGRIIINK